MKEAVERRNKDRLLEECHKKLDGDKVIKAKTVHIVEKLNTSTYKRGTEKKNGKERAAVDEKIELHLY